MAELPAPTITPPETPKPSSFKRISVMRLPSWKGLSPEVQASFIALDEALSLPRNNDAGIVNWSLGLKGTLIDALPRIEALEHRLSVEMLARSPVDALDPRTPLELPTRAAAQIQLLSGLSGHASAFPETLSELHRLIHGRSQGLRTTGVRSLPDRLGTYVVFPEVEEVRPGLESLHGFILEHVDEQPAFAAAVAMTSICNIHPFEDGNGCLSRIVLNALTRKAHTSAPYLPLHELGRISRGGFLIAMRLAQYRGEWLPLADFLRASVDFVASVPDRGRVPAVDIRSY